MSPPDKSYLQVLSELEQWGSYETSAQPRDISKLEGIRLLLKDLGHPERAFKIIHIAGTNGKGLTAEIRYTDFFNFLGSLLVGLGEP